MIQFDIIIISYASTEENRLVTKDCIDSILKTDNDNYYFNIIVVEQNKNVEYEDAMTLHYDFDFNYNKCLNYGLSHSMAKYKGLCNNDLIFHDDWADGIVFALDNGFGSASPFCLKTHIKWKEPENTVIGGYRIDRHVAGWCIFLTDETLSKIGKLNDGVSFWFSDNIYAEQLKREGIKHGLVCNSFVTHLGSNTLNQTNKREYYNITVGQKKKFEKEKAAVWGWGAKENTYVEETPNATWRKRKKNKNKFVELNLKKSDGKKEKSII